MERNDRTGKAVRERGELGRAPLRRLIVGAVVAAVVSTATIAADDYERPPRNAETGRFEYQEVVPIEGASAADLFSRAKAWVAVNYRSAKDVIQLDDAAAGTLIVRGNFEVAYMTHTAWVGHLLTVQVKEGRFRYTLSDLVFDNGHWSAPLEEEKKFMGQRKKLFTQVTTQATATLSGLKSAMNSSGQKDNW